MIEVTCPRLAAALLARSTNARRLAAAAAWCTPGRPMRLFVFGLPTA